jgi:hypothetical protein
VKDKPHGNFHKDSDFEYNKEISMVGMGEDQDLVLVLRGDSSTSIKEFTLVYKLLIEGHWYNIRKHCWMGDHGGFHTHIRMGKGKHNWKISTKKKPRSNCTVNQAIRWSQNDMWKNCYYYRRFFEKKINK